MRIAKSLGYGADIDVEKIGQFSLRRQMFGDASCRRIFGELRRQGLIKGWTPYVTARTGAMG